MRHKTVFICSLIIFAILFIDAFWIPVLTHLDSDILELIEPFWSDSSIGLITVITHLSGAEAVIIFSISTLVILSILKQWDLLAFSMMSLIGSLFLFSFFKRIVGRIRPLTKLIPREEYSFPSGHAAMSMCMCLLVYTFIKYSPMKNNRDRTLMLCLLFPMIISFTRVFLHVHYSSDVIAGMALALAWVLLMSYIYLPNEISKTRQV